MVMRKTNFALCVVLLGAVLSGCADRVKMMTPAGYTAVPLSGKTVSAAVGYLPEMQINEAGNLTCAIGEQEVEVPSTIKELVKKFGDKTSKETLFLERLPELPYELPEKIDEEFLTGFIKTDGGYTNQDGTINISIDEYTDEPDHSTYGYMVSDAEGVVIIEAYYLVTTGEPNTVYIHPNQYKNADFEVLINEVLENGESVSGNGSISLQYNEDGIMDYVSNTDTIWYYLTDRYYCYDVTNYYNAADDGLVIESSNVSCQFSKLAEGTFEEGTYGETYVLYLDYDESGALESARFNVDEYTMYTFFTARMQWYDTEGNVIVIK